jgi:hypothetical protein
MLLFATADFVSISLRSINATSSEQCIKFINVACAELQDGCLHVVWLAEALQIWDLFGLEFTPRCTTLRPLVPLNPCHLGQRTSEQQYLCECLVVSY